MKDENQDDRADRILRDKIIEWNRIDERKPKRPKYIKHSWGFSAPQGETGAAYLKRIKEENRLRRASIFSKGEK